TVSTGTPSPAAGNGSDLTPTTERGFDVFLAYNSKDEEAVKHTNLIWKALEEHDLRAWIDKNDVVVGNAPTEEMATGLKSSKGAAMLVGAQGLGRWEKSYELMIAQSVAVTNEDYRVFAVL